MDTTYEPDCRTRREASPGGSLLARFATFFRRRRGSAVSAAPGAPRVSRFPQAAATERYPPAILVKVDYVLKPSRDDVPPCCGGRAEDRPASL